jgi:hypothetical protein
VSLNEIRGAAAPIAGVLLQRAPEQCARIGTRGGLAVRQARSAHPSVQLACPTARAACGEEKGAGSWRPSTRSPLGARRPPLPPPARRNTPHRRPRARQSKAPSVAQLMCCWPLLHPC